MMRAIKCYTIYATEEWYNTLHPHILSFHDETPFRQGYLSLRAPLDLVPVYQTIKYSFFDLLVNLR